jgi:hypothetical protein
MHRVSLPLAARSALIQVPEKIVALRGGASLGPLEPSVMVDFCIVVSFLYAIFMLVPASHVPAKLFGKVNGMSPVVFWVGFEMALLASLHAFIKYGVESPLDDSVHLFFFAAQYAISALVHWWKLAQGEIASKEGMMWLALMALVSGYLALA